MGAKDPAAVLVRRLAWATSLLLLAAAAHAAPRTDGDSLFLTRVVTGLASPTTLAFLGPDDFLVLEKSTGRVRRVTAGVLAPDPVLDLPVNGCSERGLLGIAVHPELGAGTGKDWVYLYYSESGSAADNNDCAGITENVLARFEWDGSALSNPIELHTFPSPEFRHNGGPLAFGPDGKLYGVNGDGDLDGPAQNNPMSDAFEDVGVIYRLNEDGTIPADNPFFTDDMATQPEDRWFAYGVRNSFGLAFDPFDPFSLWDTENGVSFFDEINRIVPGANSGWSEIMGPGPEPATLVKLPGYTYVSPRYSIVQVVALTGLAFASEATALGAFREGNLFVADFLNGNVYEFALDDARTSLDGVGDAVANSQNELDQFRVASGFDGVSDLKEGPDGNLYVVDLGQGEVWRLGAGQPPHDLAVAKVKAPKKITRSEKEPSVVKNLKVTLVNQGSDTETIEEADLASLVTITWTSLGACPDPGTLLEPLNKTFPLELATNKKLNLSYAVTWDCANDALQSSKTEDHADFEVEVSVHHEALGDGPDLDPSDDVCPRPASGADKGCGGKDENGDVGGPIRTDVVEK